MFFAAFGLMPPRQNGRNASVLQTIYKARQRRSARWLPFPGPHRLL